MSEEVSLGICEAGEKPTKFFCKSCQKEVFGILGPFDGDSFKVSFDTGEISWSHPIVCSECKQAKLELRYYSIDITITKDSVGIKDSSRKKR